MKKLTLFILFCFTIAFNSAFGQTSNEKKYHYIRDYKAPDFKLKRFDLGITAFGASAGGWANSNSKNFSERSDFAYQQFSNTQKYQGNLRVNLHTNFNRQKTSDYNNYRMLFQTQFNTINRFFFFEEWFVGAYNYGTFGYSGEHKDDIYLSELNLRMVPAISIGYGRMEPVIYARAAMDIEKSLKKGGRLDQEYSESQLNKIADGLARINNARFYDFRLQRIKQFDELDRIMQEVGGITAFDMTYFSHLSDAYLYAQSYIRYSGFRSELGIANRTEYTSFIESNAFARAQNVMIYGNVVYDLPKTYTIQHTFSAGAIAGVEYVEISGFSASRLPVWASGDYSLGLYPTTRTNFNFGCKIGLFYEEWVEPTIALYSNGSVYLSPQFRLSYRVSAQLSGEYEAYSFGNLIPPIYNSSNGLTFGGNLSLNYAIF